MSDNIEKDLRDLITQTKGFRERVEATYSALQKQVDGIDLKLASGSLPDRGGKTEIKTVIDKITADPSYQALQQNGRGRAIVTVPNLLDVKTITASSIAWAPTTGVRGDWDAGIGDVGRRLYGRVRGLLRSLPIEVGSAEFIKETAFVDAASPQAAEGDVKNESNITFEGATAPVVTIATWAGISKQVLDDSAELGEFLSSSLIYGLQREFEEQLLDGTGTGGTLVGVSNGAQAFDTSLLALLNTPGYNYADTLALAALQLAEDGFGCTGFVVSPRDWTRIELLKDGDGNYMIGSPRGQLSEMLWGKTVVPSPAMAAGVFLAGDFNTGAHIRMRQDAVIDISDSHSDYFTRNLLAVRAELRAALVIKKPSAFVTGSLAQSPA